MEFTKGGPVENAQREARGELAAAVRSMWFIRGPSPARFERIFPMTDVHLIVNLAEHPYRVLDAADASWRVLGAGFSSGLRSRFVVSENPDPIVNAGAVVRGDGLRALGLDPQRLAGRVSSQPWLDGVAALGPDATADDVLDALEVLLVGMLRPDRAPDPLVHDAIERLEADPTQPIGPLPSPRRTASGIRPSSPASGAQPGSRRNATPSWCASIGSSTPCRLPAPRRGAISPSRRATTTSRMSSATSSASLASRRPTTTAG
jgi:hypothetical protein